MLYLMGTEWLFKSGESSKMTPRESVYLIYERSNPAVKFWSLWSLKFVLRNFTIHEFVVLKVEYNRCLHSEVFYKTNVATNGKTGLYGDYGTPGLNAH